MNSTLREWHRNQVLALRAKAQVHKGKAAVNAIRAVIAFVLWSQVHAGFWFAAVTFVLMMVFGSLAIWNLEEWNIAVRQSEIDL